MRFIVTHREIKECCVVVEAESAVQAEDAVAEAGQAGWLSDHGVPLEYSEETNADESDDEAEFYIDADDGTLVPVIKREVSRG